MAANIAQAAQEDERNFSQEVRYLVRLGLEVRQRRLSGLQPGGDAA